MSDVIAVFRSKTETYRFMEYMRKSGATCVIVTTPSNARVGCGVSAKFNYAKLNYAYKIVRVGGFTAFKGFYLISKKGSVTSVSKI